MSHLKVTQVKVEENYLTAYAAFIRCRMRGVSEARSQSSDFVVLVCFEVVKWEHHDCFKEAGLHFSANSLLKRKLIAVSC